MKGDQMTIMKKKRRTKRGKRKRLIALALSTILSKIKGLSYTDSCRVQPLTRLWRPIHLGWSWCLYFSFKLVLELGYKRDRRALSFSHHKSKGKQNSSAAFGFPSPKEFILSLDCVENCVLRPVLLCWGQFWASSFMSLTDFMWVPALSLPDSSASPPSHKPASWVISAHVCIFVGIVTY